MVAIGLGLGVSFKASGGYSPSSLFAAGEQGVWYDPSDFSTMFQDTAGTTPVTATGQAVARINDKSGRGNHATQTTAGARPTLRQDASGFYYLDFTGTEWLVSSSIGFGTALTDQMTYITGVRHTYTSASPPIVAFELSADSDANNGTFFFVQDGTQFRMRSKGTTAQEGTYAVTVPATYVATMLSEISPATITPRYNGTAGTVNSTSQGTGNFGNYALYVGARGGGSLFFQGRLYQLVIRGAATSGYDLTAAEAFVTSRTYVPAVPGTGNALIWATGNNLVWASGNNLIWGTA